MSRSATPPPPGYGFSWYGIALLQDFEPFDRYAVSTIMWHVHCVEGEGDDEGEECQDIVARGCLYNGSNMSYEDGLYWLEATVCPYFFLS